MKTLFFLNDRLVLLKRRIFTKYYLKKYSLLSSKDSQNLLFWVPGGMALMLEVEGLLALSLKLRGNKIHAIICDGVYTGCIKRELNDGIEIDNWHKTCKACKVE